MLQWRIFFLLIALVLGMFAFGGIALTATAVAKILLYLFVVLFVMSLTAAAEREGRPPF